MEPPLESAFDECPDYQHYEDRWNQEEEIDTSHFILHVKPPRDWTRSDCHQSDPDEYLATDPPYNHVDTKQRDRQGHVVIPKEVFFEDKSHAQRRRQD